MTLNEAINILVQHEQYKFKHINLRIEYEALCEIATDKFKDSVIKDAFNAVKKDRKQKLEKLNETKN